MIVNIMVNEIEAINLPLVLQVLLAMQVALTPTLTRLVPDRHSSSSVSNLQVVIQFLQSHC